MTPTEFENLVFDCARAVGLKNLIWRTPGADGGRDIEGESFTTDLSGFDIKQRWYVECKLYQKSISWPTLWEKIAYADVQGADVLLLVTNNNPSPRCETEIACWNKSKRRPIVRVWRGYDLPRIIINSPSIVTSYGLSDDIALMQSSTIPLARAVSNISQSAYTANEIGGDSSCFLEVGAALSELLTKSLDDIERFGQITVGALADKAPDYDWLTTKGSVGNFNDLGLRAILTTLKYIHGAVRVKVNFYENSAEVNLIDSRRALALSGLELINTVSEWSKIDIFSSDKNKDFYRISQR